MNARRTLYILGVVALLAVFLTGCHRPMHGDKYFPKRMLEHIDDYVEDLKLTENQNVKYQDIRSRLEADLIKQKESHKTFKAEAITVIDNQESDVKEITSMLRTKSGDFPPMIDLYLDYIDEFFDILDEQQKAQVMEKIRDKSDSKRFRS